jgi:hypothetical protein
MLTFVSDPMLQIFGEVELRRRLDDGKEIPSSAFLARFSDAIDLSAALAPACQRTLLLMLLATLGLIGDSCPPSPVTTCCDSGTEGVLYICWELAGVTGSCGVETGAACGVPAACDPPEAFAELLRDRRGAGVPPSGTSGSESSALRLLRLTELLILRTFGKMPPFPASHARVSNLWGWTHQGSCSRGFQAGPKLLSPVAEDVRKPFLYPDLTP